VTLAASGRQPHRLKLCDFQIIFTLHPEWTDTGTITPKDVVRFHNLLPSLNVKVGRIAKFSRLLRQFAPRKAFLQALIAGDITP
jgi:hypothetical protein